VRHKAVISALFPAAVISRLSCTQDAVGGGPSLVCPRARLSGAGVLTDLLELPSPAFNEFEELWTSLRDEEEL